MATATIRVSRETRDLLARQARARGVSMSAMLTSQARRAERDPILEAERAASRADAGHRDALAEQHTWQEALRDAVSTDPENAHAAPAVGALRNAKALARQPFTAALLKP